MPKVWCGDEPTSELLFGIEQDLVMEPDVSSDTIVVVNLLNSHDVDAGSMEDVFSSVQAIIEACTTHPQRCVIFSSNHVRSGDESATPMHHMAPKTTVGLSHSMAEILLLTKLHEVKEWVVIRCENRHQLPDDDLIRQALLSEYSTMEGNFNKVDGMMYLEK